MKPSVARGARLIAAIAALVGAVGAAPSTTVAATPARMAAGHLTGTAQSRAGVDVIARMSGVADRPIVSRTKTDANGNYTLPAPAVTPEMARAAASNGGYVNLMVIAGGNGVGGVKFMSVRVADGQVAPSAAPLEVATAAVAPEAANQRAVALGSGVAPDAVKPSYYTCDKSTLATTDAYTTVGEIHSWTDDTAKFEYGQTADSDIGVGISTDGTNWSLDGTYHVGNSNSASVSMTRSGRSGKLVRTSFHYEKNHYGNCPISYAVEVTNWNSGMIEGSDVSSLDGLCATTYSRYRVLFSTNTTFDRSNNSFVTFGGAVSIYGASLTAKSGASQYVKVHYGFGTATSSHSLCGSNATPPSAARIYAGG